MKKVTVVFTILCLVAIPLFMAQRCGPEHFLDGTWECVTNYGVVLRNVLILESGSFESYIYGPGEESEWVLGSGAKGTFTIDDSTMILTYTHLMSPYSGYPDWVDSSDEEAWAALLPTLPGGQLIQPYTFGMTRDLDHLFVHSYLWMQYSGDAWHYERQ